MVLKRLCASSKDNYYSQIPENGNSDPHMWDPAATLVWELAQDKARGSKDGTWKSPLWKAAKKHKISSTPRELSKPTNYRFCARSEKKKKSPRRAREERLKKSVDNPLMTPEKLCDEWGKFRGGGVRC